MQLIGENLFVPKLHRSAPITDVESAPILKQAKNNVAVRYFSPETSAAAEPRVQRGDVRTAFSSVEIRDYYLDGFTFRFNRRNLKLRGKLFSTLS